MAVAVVFSVVMTVLRWVGMTGVGSRRGSWSSARVQDRVGHGRTGSVASYRAFARSLIARVGSEMPRAAPVTALRGRDSELNAISERLAGVLAGEGSIVLIE